MFMLKSSTIELLTPELAQRLVNMATMPGERPIRPGRVAELEEWIHRDKFNNPTWAIAVLKGTNKQFRADGRHTATALVNAYQKGKFPVGCMVQITYYEIDNLKEDGPDLFLRFDDSDAVRNSTAAMNALATKHPDLHDVDPKFEVTVMNGIVYHLKDLNKRQEDPASLISIHKPKYRGLYLVDKGYRAFILWLNNHWNKLKSGKTGEPRKARNEWLMRRPEMIAEAMANYYAHSEAAAIFWNYMLDDAAPHGHPVRELLILLNDWRSRSKDKRPKADRWRREVRLVWEQCLPKLQAEVAKNKKQAS